MKNTLRLILVTCISTLLFTGCSSSKKATKGEAAPEKAVTTEKAATTVSGTVVDKDNKPIKGAYVYAYSSASKGQMGPSDFMSAPTGEKGAFILTAKPGEYFIIARRRADESNVGVLDTGDYSSPTGFTLSLKKGTDTKLTLTMEKIVEPMFFKKTGAEMTDTGVKGVILDEKGQPVPTAFAIAYKDKSMKTLPDFASVPTQADGSYTLFLPEPGTYYIGARVNTKKPPEKGELYGTYDKVEDHSVSVDKGTFIEDVNITLKPFTGTITTDFKGFD
jgi:hypothetical protein